MMTKRALPAQFAALANYLDWALPTETLRRQKREASTLEEIFGFYEAMLPRAQEIVAYFNAQEAAAGDADQVDQDTKTLFTLMLGFLDASLSVEVHKSPVVPDGMPGDQWKPEHETPGWRNKPRVKLLPKEAEG
jgi:hypothetical protein